MKLFIFTNPVSSRAVLRDSTGGSYTAKPDTHPTGRVGQSFELPKTIPNQSSVEIYLTADKMHPQRITGLLLHGPGGLAYILCDSFQLFPTGI